MQNYVKALLVTNIFIFLLQLKTLCIACKCTPAICGANTYSLV